MKPKPTAPGGRLAAPRFQPPKPLETLAVIGDVHGMLAQFERLLSRIEHDNPDARVICVGDLIDRGDESAAVLDLAFTRRGDIEVILGNHEEMLLQFLDTPEHAASRWLRNGGLQTLASYGIAAPGTAPKPQESVHLRQSLREALGAEKESWLRSLPRMVSSGDVAVTHAGADPWLPMSHQPHAALTWGARDFGRRFRTDGIWVVHGHTIVDRPRAADGVISVDTGAFAGGALSAAIIADGTMGFVGETR